MGSNINDVYYCQQNRTTELSNRMYNRNIPSHQLAPSYFSRPVDTYATVFPMLDCVASTKVHKATFPVYCQKSIFNPGQGAPFNGYSKNIDVESALHNSFAPLQHCAQSKFISGSGSDLYNTQYLTRNAKRVPMTNSRLFQKDNFSPFNPNTCNLGHKIFNNHIRIQTKNIELVKEVEGEILDNIKLEEEEESSKNKSDE